MFINPVSENEVEKVVKKLKGKCSSGFDSVTDFICIMHFPRNTKDRNTGVQNYRPISLLSFFSKIVENLMYIVCYKK